MSFAFPTSRAEDSPEGPPLISPRAAGLLVVGVGLGLFVLRFLAPPEVADEYHQERAAAYVMDALRNGHWICQYGAEGEVSSKPPMLTWLAALASLPFGRGNWFAMVLPSALATVGSALLILSAGRKWFGMTAGLLSALVYLISPIGLKQVALARIDPLFTFTVLLTALLAFQAWMTGRGWVGFWLAAAAATLTKGPLGLVFGALGLIAVFWERRGPSPAPLRGSHSTGVLLFLVITGGWLALAYTAMGPPLVQTMLGNELVKHAVGGRDNQVPLREFYKPTLYFLSRFLPWSLFALAGLWRVWRRPSTEDHARRFERFLFCFFTAGLLMFSLAAHQRPDLIFPLIPVAALLAGRELAWHATQVPPRTLRFAVAGVVVTSLVLAALNQSIWRPKSTNQRRSQVVREVAEWVRTGVGEAFPFTYLDAPYGLQFCLNTKYPFVSEERARRLLAGEAAAFVVTGQRRAWPPELRLHEIVSRPMVREETLQILGNVPELKWTERMATYVGAVHLLMERVEGMEVTAGEFRLAGADADAAVTFTNESDRPERVRVRWQNEPTSLPTERLLAPGERWRITRAPPRA
jgi:4-amino-4-deoxy-L-arabinose transferase-like glycosyltransferase